MYNLNYLRALQLHRAEGDGGGQQSTPPQATPAVPPTIAPASAPPASAAQIAEETLKLINAASEKKEHGITKSMADQYGLTEDELKAAIDAKKAEKSAKLSPEAQKQIDDANAELNKLKVTTVVTKEGSAMGLLDVDVAMQLLPKDAVKVDAKGEITGVKEALEGLKKDKPYLFGETVKPPAMAQKVGNGTSVETEKSVRDEIKSQLFGW